MFLSYQELSWIVHQINLSIGFTEQLDLLRHLTLTNGTNQQVINKTLALIVEHLVDSPIIKKVEALLLMAEVFDKRPFTRRCRELIKLLDSYCEYSKYNELSPNIIEQTDTGIHFYKL